MAGSKYRFAEICAVLLLAMLTGCWSGGNEKKSGSYIDVLEKFAEESSTGTANKGVVWGGLCDFRFQHLAQTDVNEQMKWDKEPFTLSEFRINCKLVSKEGYPYHEAMQQNAKTNKASSQDKNAAKEESTLYYLRVCAHKKQADSEKDIPEKTCNHTVTEENVTTEDVAAFFSVVLLAAVGSENQYRYRSRLSEREFDSRLEKLAEEAVSLAEKSIYDEIYKKTLIQANLKWGSKDGRPKEN